ncbi:class I SAM-dependent methyltransferase [Roseomonas sp. WA12]
MPHVLTTRLALGLVLLSAIPGCGSQAAEVGPLGPPGVAAGRFASPVRPVAPVVSDRWRAEDERERVGEAARVIAWLGIRPGMTVADLGAGSGYYTTRLSAQVGPEGRVLAQDVVPSYLARLRDRVVRAGLINVSVGLGEAGDPRLPPRSMDVALLIHMYHEIEQPFALLANLVPALRPGGRVGILDVDDATERHGTPRALLACELSAAGYRQVAFHWLLEQPPRSEYLAVFEPPVSAPSPETIRPCQP